MHIEFAKEIIKSDSNKLDITKKLPKEMFDDEEIVDCLINQIKECVTSKKGTTLKAFLKDRKDLIDNEIIFLKALEDIPKVVDKQLELESKNLEISKELNKKYRKMDKTRDSELRADLADMNRKRDIKKTQWIVAHSCVESNSIGSLQKSKFSSAPDYNDTKTEKKLSSRSEVIAYFLNELQEMMGEELKKNSKIQEMIKNLEK